MKGLAQSVMCSGGSKKAVATDSGALRPPDPSLSFAEGCMTEERSGGLTFFLSVPQDVKCGKVPPGLVGAGDSLPSGCGRTEVPLGVSVAGQVGHAGACGLG